MKSKSSEIRFLYADSEQSADMLYLGGVFVPDAFLAGIFNGRSFAVVSQLEYGRVRASSRFGTVYLLETVKKEAGAALGLELSEVGPAELMRFFVAREGAESIQVPSSFPAVYFSRLLAAGLEPKVLEGGFFPKRACKSDLEAAAIRQGNGASAAGIRRAEKILRGSKIVGHRLMYQGRLLTSERLRMEIDQACLQRGAVARHTIVAGGRQACDPHEGGHGPLRPNELIIVDVFPRVQKTGYHGDLTRTFLKGRASEGQRALVGAVQAAQAAALDKIKPGVSGSSVHGAAADVFKTRGFVTERRGENFVGFIHSTGHGLGLEVHESPRVSQKAGALKRGHVITVEPGLYYPEVGGCRIEDVVRVVKGGCERLSSLHYRWEIR